MDLIERYSRLPVFAQNVACSWQGYQLRRVRLGTAFRARYDWLLETESASAAEIAAYQDEQVAKLIEHAFATVPYYRRVMEERGLRPSDVTSVADLRRLPILRKEDVVAHGAEMLSSAFSPDALVGHGTSGTTGKALRFQTTRDALAFQWAVWWRHRARFGVAPLTQHLNFTTRPVVPVTRTAPPYWRWNLPMRQALVTVQHFTPEKVRDIARFVDAHGFRFFSGYASMMHAFAALLEEQGIELSSPPEYIFLGGEPLHEFQRPAVERVLRARITDQYGLAEGCGNASRCERDRYHEDWEFGVLQCEDPEEQPDGTLRGRVVATGFANYASPFIRYDIGDTASWSPAGFACECGRSSQVIDAIDGRHEEYLLTPEGVRFMRFPLLFRESTNMREAQVVQRERSAVVIRFVPRPGFSGEDERRIRERARTWISPNLRVDFEPVDEIPRGPGGKFQLVVSELEAGEGAERCGGQR